MSAEKKARRNAFRIAVFTRDRFCCVMCGLQATESTAVLLLDAHHVTPRDEMPGGGYVVENGATLCRARCHDEAERGRPSRARLYKRVRSSYERAHAASLASAGD